jgi:heat shock protein HslJ
MRPASAVRCLAALIALPLGLWGLIGCGELNADSTAGPFVGSTYVSTGVVEAGQPKPLVEGTQLTLTFTDDGVNASAGCNQLFATGGIEDGVLVLSGVGSTEMACDPAIMAQEQWWGEFLASRPTVEVGEQTLTLSAQNVTVAMASQPSVPDRPLEGTVWTLDTIITGEAASNVPVASSVAFAESTMTVVVVGCRETVVPVTLAETTVTYDPTAFAPASCTDASAAVDEAVLAVFQTGSADYVIEGDRLTLSGPSEHGLVYLGS